MAEEKIKKGKKGVVKSVLSLDVPNLALTLSLKITSPVIVPPASGKKGPPIGPCKSATVQNGKCCKRNFKNIS